MEVCVVPQVATSHSLKILICMFVLGADGHYMESMAIAIRHKA
jgi:hypothetical protein